MPALYKNGIPTTAGIAVWNRLSPWIGGMFMSLVKGGLDPSEVERMFIQCARDAETRAWGWVIDSQNKQRTDDQAGGSYEI